jgi:hypothetical protein
VTIQILKRWRALPTIYATEEAEKPIEFIVSALRKYTNNLESRIVRADVVHEALSEHAKKLRRR